MGLRLGHILQDLVQAALLGRGQFEGQRSQKGVQQRLVAWEWASRLALPLLALAQHAQLDEEELVERQPVASLLGSLAGLSGKWIWRMAVERSISSGPLAELRRAGDPPDAAPNDPPRASSAAASSGR